MTPTRRSPRGTWDRERVVAALQDWTRVVGSPPRSYEWAPATAAVLGRTTARVRLWAAEHPRWPSAKTVCAHHGRWSDALRAAGLAPHHAVAPGAGRADRVVAAQRMARAGLRTATIADLLEISPRTVRAYLHAGSCADCGEPAVTARLCPRCAARRAMVPRATREQAIAAIRAWTERHGEPPRIEHWAPPDGPSTTTIRTHFGSWAAALEAAGCAANRRRWDRPAIVEALRRFAAETGAPPRHGELRGPRLPSPGTLRHHFGSHAAALEAAGLQNLGVRNAGAPRCGPPPARAPSPA